MDILIKKSLNILIIKVKLLVLRVVKKKFSIKIYLKLLFLYTAFIKIYKYLF